MTVSWYSPPSKWHLTRLWIGYASLVSRPVMPLAKFFQGDTHKWYFRFAGTALAATYVSAVSIRFDGDSRWVAYLVGFGAVSLIYWGLYAPSKWAYSDNCYEESLYVLPFVDNLPQEPLLNPVVQGIVRPEMAYGQSTIPREIEVLREYVRLRGRFEKRGTYMHTRQWSPPGYWRGHLEYQILERTAHEINLWESGLLQNELALDYLDHMCEKNHMATYTVLVIAVLLDDESPGWRDKARRWEERSNGRLLEATNWVRRRMGKPWIINLARLDGKSSNWFRRSLERTKESS